MLLIHWSLFAFIWHLLFSICFANSTNESTLRFVHIIWRHGDRSPDYPGTFPTDPNNLEKTWPQGWGELTQLGMRQHFFLGSFLRKRYIDSSFLSENYSSKEIYVRSTDFNRTIMSALANLAGMYPPPKNDQWMENMNWQPIPVHTVPKENDPMLWMYRPCPTADKIYFNEILKSEAVRQVEAEYARLLAYLRYKSSHPISTLDEVRFIYDPLNSELSHNDTHAWPDWVTPSLFNQIEELHLIAKKFLYYDPRIQRFRGSLLFSEIAARCEQKSQSKLPALKYYVYSAHDLTMQALFENFGFFDGKIPPPASAMIFELHEKADKQFVIQALYLNETGSETPFPIVIKECEEVGTCSLEKFADMARRQTPSDWYRECGLPKAG